MSESLKENNLYKKITLRLIPFLFVAYLAAYLDRVNVGFAKLQMLSDLNFSETVYGLGAGIFFIGYFLFEVPSNILLEKIGPRIWIARIMVTWGVLSSCMVFISSETSYYVLRFLLGIAEAGFFPGIILYLTYWYPQDRRGRIVALFMSAIAFSGVLGSPLSGWIMEYFSGTYGLAGWKWIFLIEGLPSVLLGIVTFFYLDDSIQKAKWLSADEKSYLQSRLDVDAATKTHLPIAKVFTDVRVWLFSAIDFFIIMGLYGIGFWLPNIIKSAGVTDVFHNGLLSAIPYFVAAILMVLIGKNSDRTGERHWHLFVLTLLGAAGFWLTSMYSHHLVIVLLGITIAATGVFSSLALFWSLPTAYLAGSAAAAGIAMINSIGNLSGFVSPFVLGWIKDSTGSLSDGLKFLAISIVIGGGLALSTKALKPARAKP